MLGCQVLDLIYIRLIGFDLPGKEHEDAKDALRAVSELHWQTSGQLRNRLNLPDEDLAEQVRGAVEARNYMAHHYLRDGLGPFQRDTAGREGMIASLEKLIAEQIELNDRLTQLADQRSREAGMDPGAIRQVTQEMIEQGLDLRTVRDHFPGVIVDALGELEETGD